MPFQWKRKRNPAPCLRLWVRSHYRAVGNRSVSLGHFQALSQNLVNIGFRKRPKKALIEPFWANNSIFRQNWVAHKNQAITNIFGFFVVYTSLIARGNDAMSLCNGHWATFVQNLKTKTNQTWFKKHNPCIPSDARPLIFTIIILCHVRAIAFITLWEKNHFLETLRRRTFER